MSHSELNQTGVNVSLCGVAGEYVSGCTVYSCMYSVEGKCQYEKIQSLQSHSPESIAELFDVSKPQLNRSVEDVQAIIVLNKFFHYTFGRSLLECTTVQAKQIRNGDLQAKYEAWPTRLTKPPYSSLVTILSKIQTSL